jgi:hypothetical protein
MQRICNRLLVVVANSTQLEQALTSLPEAMKRVGVKCKSVRKFSESPHFTRSLRDGEIEIVVTTIQMVHSCSDKEGGNKLEAMMDTRGQWMIAADEFHHYGEGMAWGDALKVLIDHEACSFRLALSATPSRDGTKTIFDPVTDGLRVSYVEAIAERAVKKLLKSSFLYTLTLDNGTTLTTSDIKSIVDEHGDFTAYELKKNLRYDPGYCSPLIREPAARLIQQREELGRPVQMLVRALSCRHANHLVEAYRLHFKGLSVDWVGTGDEGRDEDVNRRVLESFKPTDGTDPSLAVLVQVGMASEGFDSVLVTEIVDFALVTLEGNANQTKQFIGRGSRVIPGLESVPCYVNTGTDHPIALASWSLNEWIDSSDSFDELPEAKDGESISERDWLEDWEYEPQDLSFEPKIESVELENISIESEDVRDFATKLATIQKRRIDLQDPQDQEDILKAFLWGARKETERLSEDAKRQRAADVVETEKSNLAFLMLQRELQHRAMDRSARSKFLGEAKAKISAWLKRRYGGNKDAMKTDELRSQAEDIQNAANILRSEGRLPWV